MENIDNKIESPIINVIEKKNESNRWASPKKMTAVLVGSLSLTTVGVKVFGAENYSSESTGVPVEISTDTTLLDPNNPDQPPVTDTLAPDQPPVTDTLAPDQPPVTDTLAPDQPPVTDTLAPDQPPVTDTLAPDQPPVTDTLAPDQPPVTEPPIPQQDVYGDICSPMGWSSCGEYNIYDANGNLVNRVIADNSWSPEYIASISGGGDTGTAEKTQDINPIAP